MVKTRPATFSEYASALEQRLEALRVALSAAVDVAVPPEGRTVRTFARQMNLRRAAAHKVLLLASTSQPAIGLPAWLGPATWRSVVEALRSRGVPDPAVAGLHKAIKEVDTLRKIDSSQQWMVRLAAAGGLDTAAERATSLAKRKAVYEATIALSGISARARVARYVLAPSSTPGRVDVLQWTVFEGLRRTRPGPPWRLAPGLSPPGESSATDRVCAIVDAGDHTPLVPEFSSPEAAGDAIESGVEPNDLAFGSRRLSLGSWLGGPDVAIRATFALMRRAIGSAFAVEKEDHADFQVGATPPMEWLMLDLLVDRRLQLGSVPIAGLFPSRAEPGSRRDLVSGRLPVEANVNEVEWSVTGKRKPELPLPREFDWFRSLDEKILERSSQLLGDDGAAPCDRFRCWRVVVHYPPVPSILTAGFRLPAPPRARTPRSRRG